jgi:hypothetical protein
VVLGNDDAFRLRVGERSRVRNQLLASHGTSGRGGREPPRTFWAPLQRWWVIGRPGFGREGRARTAPSTSPSPPPRAIPRQKTPGPTVRTVRIVRVHSKIQFLQRLRGRASADGSGGGNAATDAGIWTAWKGGNWTSRVSVAPPFHRWVRRSSLQSCTGSPQCPFHLGADGVGSRRAKAPGNGFGAAARKEVTTSPTAVGRLSSQSVRVRHDKWRWAAEPDAAGSVNTVPPWPSAPALKLAVYCPSEVRLMPCRRSIRG